MIVRVSDRSVGRNYLKALNRNLYNYSKCNERISSGVKFSRISEDVSSGVRILRAQDQLYKSEKHHECITSVASRLTAAESSLRSMDDVLKTVQEKTLKAMNGTHGEVDLSVIAKEVGDLSDEIFQLANSTFSDEYLFGGTNNKFAPFSTDANGRMTYNGIPVEDIKRDDATGKYYHMVDVQKKNTDGNLVYTKADGTEVPAVGDPPIAADDPLVLDGTYKPAMEEVKKDIPMDDDVYIDIGLGITFKGDSLDSRTAVKISFSGIDMMGFGKDPETGLSNNVYNILKDLQKAISSGDSEEMGKLHTQLVKQTDALRKSTVELGSRTNYLENTQNKLQEDIDGLKDIISDLGATDTKTESTNMKMAEYAWMATLSIGSKILPTSLLDFIR